MFASNGSVSQSTIKNQKAQLSGGTLYSDSTYYYRVFTGADYMWCSGGNITTDWLLICGGGGGGSSTLNTDYLSGSGAGAGSVLATSVQMYGKNRWLVGIGAGGPIATRGGNTSVWPWTTLYLSSPSIKIGRAHV